MAKDQTPVQEKQYYVLIDYKEAVWKKGWKKGQIISLSQEEALAYIGSKVITPLRTALNKGQYVPKIEIATYTKPKSTSSPTTEEPKKRKPKKKTLIKNSLRTAVQEKKTAKNEPLIPSSSSPAEDAIKDKIAAAKAKKK